jgi:hypothetical protein
MRSWHWRPPSFFFPNTVYETGSSPLNPVEYLWSRWKQHELPNFCSSALAQLSLHARRALKRIRRRPTLMMAFWQQAQLFPL